MSLGSEQVFPKPRISIVTGADDHHLPYLLGLLNSLAFNNDVAAGVFVMDFGLSPETQDRIRVRHPGVAFLPISRIDADIAEMRKTPGVQQIEGIAYVLSTMRKLELAEYDLGDYFLWLDADTLVLRPVSEWLPEPRPRAIYAARNSWQDQYFQFKDRNPLVRHALADHLVKSVGSAAVSRNSFNSGVILADAGYYAELVAWARETFLHDYGPYLLGDQAIINTAMNLRNELALNMPAGVNVSIPGADAEMALTEAGPHRLLCPIVRGEIPAVYHYLFIKPLTHKDRDHPVVKLYDWWQAERPAGGASP